MEKYNYPAYRKYTNNKSYFKIFSPTIFIELQQVGSKWVKHKITAQQYPEKLRIQDMLESKEGRWIEISEEEFKRIQT